MGNCQVNIQINFYVGVPAPFAAITVYEVNCVWFACWESLVQSTTTDAYGRCTLSLNKGSQYHLFYEAADAAGNVRKTNFKVTLTHCPYNLTTQMPS